MGRLLIFVIFIMLHSALVAEPTNIVIASDSTIHAPPMFWVDSCTGEQMGYGVSLFRRLWKDMDVEVDAIAVEYRTQHAVQQILKQMNAGEIDLIPAMPKIVSSDRFVYSKEPAYRFVASIFYRAERGFEYRQWSDLKGRSGILTIASKAALKSSEFYSYANKELDVRPIAGDFIGSMKSLFRGEIDYVIIYKLGGLALAQELQMPEDIQRREIDNVYRPMHVAIAPGSPMAARVDEIDQLLALYTNSGLRQLLMTTATRRWLQAGDETDCPDKK